MNYLIGLTGLIGSGKSLATQYFKENNAYIIDTDKIAHEISNHKETLLLIKNKLGKEFIAQDGTLDRKKARDIVFKDTCKLKTLEEILHPLIFLEVEKKIKLVDNLCVIIVVPLLFKSNKYVNLINRSVFIDCNEETLIKRVMNRNNMTKDEVLKILSNQLPRNEQMALANDIIDNNGNQDQLQLQVDQLTNKYNILLNNVNG